MGLLEVFVLYPGQGTGANRAYGARSVKRTQRSAGPRPRKTVSRVSTGRWSHRDSGVGYRRVTDGRYSALAVGLNP